jgi:hypothetical protein
MSNKRMVRVYAKEPVNYFQDGGMQAPQQQMDQEQLMQIIQMFAQVTGNDPEQVMAQFQELDPETQMQAIEQMIQMIQSEQAAQAPEPMPGEGMQQGMPASEAEAQMMGAPGEGEMAEQMMLMGGMYAKSQKKLLKKAVGGSLGKKGDTSKSMQEKLGEAVRSAIGLNFTENLIENSAKGFNDRNMNQFANGGNAPDNTYFSSANQMAKDAYRDQMSAGALFDERLENMGSSINPYLKIKGKAIGDEYNMFNRPKFTQNVFGADIESSGYGALFPENIPSQYMGGQPDIPLFQNAGQTDVQKLEQAQKDQVLKLSEAHSKGMISDAEYMETMNKLDDAYSTAVDPKDGRAVYDEKPKGTGYDYNLRWKGNLDKATENLYLKGADLKTGFLNRNNIRKAAFTFGERGTGMGAPGDVAQINGQTDSKIDQQGALNYPKDATSQGISDQQIQRMDERAERRMERNRNRYARMFGEDAAAKQFENETPVMQSSNMGTGPYAGLFNYAQQMQSDMNAPAAAAQSIMNIGTQGTTGDYMDQFGQNPMGYRFGGMTNFGYGLPLAVDGMNNFNSEEDKFKITMKEKSGIGSAAAPLVMAKIQEGLGSINTARALQQQNLAYNPALNNPVVPGDMLGSLGSFTSTTGPSVFMPNQMQGMMQGRFGAAQPAQMQGMYYTQLGGQPDLSGYGVGDDAYLTDQEIEAFMRMGGKVEYY